MTHSHACPTTGASALSIKTTHRSIFVHVQSRSRYIAVHTRVPSSCAPILAWMGWMGQGGLHQLFSLPWWFFFVNFILLKIWAEPADLRCGEGKYSSIQPTWNIHPFALKWAHSYWARVHGRQCILTVAVSSFNFLAVKKVRTMSVRRLIPAWIQNKKSRQTDIHEHC